MYIDTHVGGYAIYPYIHTCAHIYTYVRVSCLDCLGGLRTTTVDCESGGTPLSDKIRDPQADSVVGLMANA